MLSKYTDSILFKSIALVLVCLFFADSVVLANPDTLSPLAGNPKAYQAMRNMMEERLAEQFREYLKQEKLSQYEALGDLNLYPNEVKNALLSDPTLRPVFMLVLSEKDGSAGHLKVVDRKELESIGGENLLLNHTAFGINDPKVANGLVKQGKRIIVGVADRECEDKLFINFNVANGRQAYFPLPDSTWLGVKGSGQNSDPTKPSYYYDITSSSQGYVGLCSQYEAISAEKYALLLRQSQGRFVRMLGYRNILALPDMEGKLLRTEYTNAETIRPVLIFNRVATPHRLSKLPQIFKSDPTLEKMCGRISRALASLGHLPEGKVLSPQEWMRMIAEEMGRQEAIKENLDISKWTLHEQDIDLGGEEADNEEWRCRSNDDKGLIIKLVILIYFLESKQSNRYRKCRDLANLIIKDPSEVLRAFFIGYFYNLNKQSLEGCALPHGSNMYDLLIGMPMYRFHSAWGSEVPDKSLWVEVVDKIVSLAQQELVRREIKDRVVAVVPPPTAPNLRYMRPFAGESAGQEPDVHMSQPSAAAKPAAEGVVLGARSSELGVEGATPNSKLQAPSLSTPQAKTAPGPQPEPSPGASLNDFDNVLALYEIMDKAGLKNGIADTKHLREVITYSNPGIRPSLWNDFKILRELEAQGYSMSDLYKIKGLPDKSQLKKMWVHKNEIGVSQFSDGLVLMERGYEHGLSFSQTNGLYLKFKSKNSENIILQAHSHPGTQIPIPGYTPDYEQNGCVKSDIPTALYQRFLAAGKGTEFFLLKGSRNVANPKFRRLINDIKTNPLNFIIAGQGVASYQFTASLDIDNPEFQRIYKRLLDNWVETEKLDNPDARTFYRDNAADFEKLRSLGLEIRYFDFNDAWETFEDIVRQVSYPDSPIGPGIVAMEGDLNKNMFPEGTGPGSQSKLSPGMQDVNLVIERENEQFLSRQEPLRKLINSPDDLKVRAEALRTLGVGTRLFNNNFLNPVRLAQFEAVRKIINPNNEEKQIGIYLAAGSDISCFLEITDAQEGYFFDRTPINAEKLKQYSGDGEWESLDETRYDNLDKYKKSKWDGGWTGTRKEGIEHIEQSILFELKEMGVKKETIHITETNGLVSISFMWAYSGQNERSREIKFVTGDILSEGNGLTPTLRKELEGKVNVVLIKAGFNLPYYFDKFLPKYTQLLKPGAFLVTDNYFMNTVRYFYDDAIPVAYPIYGYRNPDEILHNDRHYDFKRVQSLELDFIQNEFCKRVHSIDIVSQPRPIDDYVLCVGIDDKEWGWMPKLRESYPLDIPREHENILYGTTLQIRQKLEKDDSVVLDEISPPSASTLRYMRPFAGDSAGQEPDVHMPQPSAATKPAAEGVVLGARSSELGVEGAAPSSKLQAPSLSTPQAKTGHVSQPEPPQGTLPAHEWFKLRLVAELGLLSAKILEEIYGCLTIPAAISTKKDPNDAHYDNIGFMKTKDIERFTNPQLNWDFDRWLIITLDTPNISKDELLLKLLKHDFSPNELSEAFSNSIVIVDSNGDIEKKARLASENFTHILVPEKFYDDTVKIFSGLKGVSIVSVPQARQNWNAMGASKNACDIEYPDYRKALLGLNIPKGKLVLMHMIRLDPGSSWRWENLASYQKVFALARDKNSIAFREKLIAALYGTLKSEISDLDQSEKEILKAALEEQVNRSTSQQVTGPMERTSPGSQPKPSPADMKILLEFKYTLEPVEVYGTRARFLAKLSFNSETDLESFLQEFEVYLHWGIPNKEKWTFTQAHALHSNGTSLTIEAFAHANPDPIWRGQEAIFVAVPKGANPRELINASLTSSPYSHRWLGPNIKILNAWDMNVSGKMGPSLLPSVSAKPAEEGVELGVRSSELGVEGATPNSKLQTPSLPTPQAKTGQESQPEPSLGTSQSIYSNRAKEGMCPTEEQVREDLAHSRELTDIEIKVLRKVVKELVNTCYKFAQENPFPVTQAGQYIEIADYLRRLKLDAYMVGEYKYVWGAYQSGPFDTFGKIGLDQKLLNDPRYYSQLKVNLVREIRNAIPNMDIGQRYTDMRDNEALALKIALLYSDVQTEESKEWGGFIDSLRAIAKSSDKEIENALSELDNRVVKYRKNGQSIILYADDMLGNVAVVDLEDAVRNVLVKHDLLNGGKIVLFARKEANAAILEKLIKRAGPDISVVKLTQDDLGTTGDEIKEVDALVRHAKAKGVGEILALIKGDMKNAEGLADFARDNKLPIIIVGQEKGAYSFAQALAMAIDAKLSKDDKNGWLIILPPLTNLTANMLREYEESLRVLINA